MGKTNWSRPKFVKQGKRTEEWNSTPRYPDAADRFLAQKEKEQADKQARNEKRKIEHQDRPTNDRAKTEKSSFDQLNPRDPFDQLPGVDLTKPPW
jgi:hypothetical protein